MAASHALAWAPAQAIAALEAITRETGLHAVTATYTLKGFRNGTLNMAWCADA